MPPRFPLAILLPAVWLAANPAFAEDPLAVPFPAQPLLQKYCYSCHGEAKQKGGIDLRPLTTVDSAFRQHRFLESVASQVESGDMPPDDEDVQPTPGERAAMLAQVHSVLSRLSAGEYPRNPGRPTIRRLNRTEYENTLRDLFELNFPVASDLPADGAGGEGFDNVGDSLFVPPSLMEKYLSTARNLIARIQREPGLQGKLITIWPSAAKQPGVAARELLAGFLPHAFRRPVTAEEVEPFGLAFDRALASGASYLDSLRVPFQAILVHPSFLFRVEADQPGKDHWRLTDCELATRLSYFLWASTPDGTLLQLAMENKLSDPAVLRGEVERMLKDPRAKSLGQSFAAQWLGFDALRESAQPDSKRFPEFTSSLRTAMFRESTDFFNYLVSENRPVTELIKSDYTFLNAELARNYGIPGISGEDMRKVTLTDPQRGGVIGQGSILVSTSQPLRTSPVKRGKWILDTLLGTPPPPPPPDAGVLPPDDHSPEGLTFRQQLEAHRTRASCAGCHAKIDPLGFGLENFDPIGRWRAKGVDGKPVDSSAELPDGRHFSTPAELKDIVLNSGDLFLRNFARKLLAYALGRPLEYYDEAVVTELVARLRADDLKMQTLILGIVESDPFQNRSATR